MLSEILGWTTVVIATICVIILVSISIWSGWQVARHDDILGPFRPSLKRSAKEEGQEMSEYGLFLFLIALAIVILALAASKNCS